MNNKKISTVKKVILSASLTIAIICAIFVGFLDDSWNETTYWNSNNISHIGSISLYDEDGNTLDDGWVRFGRFYWYKKKITDAIRKDNDFGSLIMLYTYYNNNENHEFYGETVGLWVYDIEPKLTELGLTRDSLYAYIFKKYSNDTTNFWKPTRAVEPFLALTSGPAFTISSADYVGKYQEQFIVFANNRIYFFDIYNDELKRENFEENIFQVFDKRCLEIVSNIDFSEYHQWETDYNDNEAKNKALTLWIRILSSIALLCLLLVFFMSIHPLGRLNIQARNLFFFGTSCFIISIVVCLCSVWLDAIPLKDWRADIELSLLVIGVTIVYTLLMSFLSYRSNENHYEEYLIPSWVISKFNITSVVGKRILLIVLFYPLFYLFPIPIIGTAVLFYFLPVSVFVLFVLGIKWILDGRNVKNSTIIKKELQTMYCRHCGKEIDADSGFCRYCGKKIK